MNKSINKTTIPRDASSVIIIKKKYNKLYVLMGRRPRTSKFMPGIYVFPGGALDKSDFKINKIFKLSTKVRRDFVKTRSDNHTIAIMLAAIRETAEESGLYLIEKRDFKCSSINHAKVWQTFINNSFVPSINNLYYFGRAITPSFLKIRYHARFFIADYNNFSGKIKSDGELENIDWIDIKKASLLPVADVTEFLINRLIAIDKDNEIFKKINAYPMFTRRNNKESIKWDM